MSATPPAKHSSAADVGAKAATGVRRVDVAPARLVDWLAGFSARHGDVDVRVAGDLATLTAADGSTAVLDPPFPPMPPAWADDVDSSDGSPNPIGWIASIAAHAAQPRVFAVLLVRLGGYAAGVFDDGKLIASKVGARQVHGRSAAGGWSQHRFARRREGQVRVALDAAAEAAVRVIAPALSSSAGPVGLSVVTGGDRQALRGVLADPRLSTLRPLVVNRVLDVPDPKARVLNDSFAAAVAIRVTVSDGPGSAAGRG